MGRFGCLLMILAFVALAALVVLPVIGPFRDNSTLMSLQAAINCPPGYTFENEFQTFRPRPGETIESATGYCISPDGETRTQLTADEQGRFFIIAIGSFVVPFIVGLFLFIGAVTRATTGKLVGKTMFGDQNLAVPVGEANSRAQAFVNSRIYTQVASGQTKVDANTAEWVKKLTGVDIDYAPDGSVQITMPGQDTPMTVQSTHFGGVTLSERLKQLDDAKAQGLISQAEYDKLRQAALDELL